MTLPTLYAVLAMVLFGLGDFAVKRAADMAVKPHHSVMVQSWVFSSSIAIYALATGPLTVTPAVLWGAATGLLMVIGFTAFVRSLTSESVSIQAPVFRLNFIIAALIAIVVLGEPLTVWKAAALLLALLAVWLLLGSGRIAIGRKALGQVLFATVVVGIGNITHKVGLRYGAAPEMLVLAQAAVFMPLATLQTLVVERRLNPPARAFIYPPLAGLFMVIGYIFLVGGLAIGEASVVVPISQMGFVVTALLGISMLGERLTARKAAGLVAAVVSLLVFTL